MPPMHYGMQFAHIDVVTSVIIAMSCFVIVYIASYVYSISKHRGIKYFSHAFLFFGITYLAPLIRPNRFMMIHHPWIPITITIITIFSGTLAVLCLLYSVLWKKLPEKHHDPLIILIAISTAITIATMYTQTLIIALALQTIIFLAALATNFTRKESKKHMPMNLLYTLLFIAWIANITANFTTIIGFIGSITLNIISAILFMIIMFKVLNITVKK